jgi:AraC-like DNA-binding protein
LKDVVYSGMMNGLSIDRSTRNVTYNMVKHWHSEVEIQYFLAGSRNFFISDQNYKVGAGSLVIIDSEQVHNTFTDKEAFHDRILLSFECSKFGKALAKMDIDLEAFFSSYHGVLQVPAVDRPYVEKIFNEIASEVKEKNNLYQTIVQSRFAELIVYLIRLKMSGSKSQMNESANLDKNELVNQVANYIRDNYDTVGTLDDLAKLYYLDKSYLSRQFKKVTGFTITEFTNIQKIRQAQRLLEDTQLNISEIAEKCGYDNLTYFNRVFKKYVETSPLKFRKKQSAYQKSMRSKNLL